MPISYAGHMVNKNLIVLVMVQDSVAHYNKCVDQIAQIMNNPAPVEEVTFGSRSVIFLTIRLFVCLVSV